MPRITIKALQAELAETKTRLESRSKQLSEAICQKEGAKKEVEETREQFADLKKRLHESEMEVSRLNGYLARVREDDVVREDLITVGEPGGEQRLVPKRRPQLEQPISHDTFNALHDSYDSYGNRRSKPKHWIEY